MRKQRDGESTKEVVMTAAKEVFAERGFSGTSLAMISKRCGISDGLILHHFKNKKNLYRLILEDLANEYAHTVMQSVHKSDNSEQAARDMLQTIFRFWSEDSLYARLSMWAYLEDQTELIDGELELTAKLADAVAQMQQAGFVDPRFSPFVLLTMTIGPIQFWMRYRSLFKEALKLDDTEPVLNQDFLTQYIELIRKVYQPEDDKKEEL